MGGTVLDKIVRKKIWSTDQRRGGRWGDKEEHSCCEKSKYKSPEVGPALEGSPTGQCDWNRGCQVWKEGEMRRD